MILNDIDKQIIKSTKQFNNDEILDLKKVIGKWTAIEYNKVELKDIYYFVSETFFKCCSVDTMKNLMWELIVKNYNSPVDLENTILKICSKLSILKIRDDDKFLIDLE